MKNHWPTALDRLKKSSYKVTQARLALLKYLVKNHGPYTIEDIHVKIGCDTCDLATIYRNVEVLMNLNLLNRCEFGDGVSRYEFKNPNDHHHHLVCRTCRRIETIDACFFDSIKKHVSKLGYSDLTHQFEVFGICPKCRKKAQNSHPKT